MRQLSDLGRRYGINNLTVWDEPLVTATVSAPARKRVTDQHERCLHGWRHSTLGISASMRRSRTPITSDVLRYAKIGHETWYLGRRRRRKASATQNCPSVVVFVTVDVANVGKKPKRRQDRQSFFIICSLYMSQLFTQRHGCQFTGKCYKLKFEF